jgi:uncharacterized protein (TIGR02271 family)
MERAGVDALARVRMEDGPQLLVPVSMLALQSDGAYRLPFSLDLSDASSDARASFPVLQEELHVGKRTVDTGRGVRVRKTVTQSEEAVDQSLLRDELQVEHVPVGAIVADTDVPQTRYEGDTLVVPVLEEVLVVQKQLRLKEEVRITRHRREVHAQETVSLRAEQVAVERFDEGKGPPR